MSATRPGAAAVVSPPLTRPMRIARGILVAVGAAGIVLGAYVLVDTVKPVRIWGLVTWLIGAVILHDAILSPIIVGLSILFRRAGRRVRPAVLWIVQGAIVVGSVFTLIVVPEIIRKAKIPKNPTVLPFDYAERLLVLWGVVAVLAAALIVVYLRVARRREARAGATPPFRQDPAG